MRRQIGHGQCKRDARPAATGPAVRQEYARLHGELEDIRAGLELGRGPCVPGVPRRPGGGEPTGRPSARRARRRVSLAAGHHVPLALARPEL